MVRNLTKLAFFDLLDGQAVAFVTLVKPIEEDGLGKPGGQTGRQTHPSGKVIHEAVAGLSPFPE